MTDETGRNTQGEPELSPAGNSGTPLLAAVILIGLAVIFFLKIGVYTVQPIGAIPEGVTLVVWREAGEPFFSSPDGVCLRINDGVSLLCRGMAMQYAPADRVILRLPYQHWAYLQSTGGLEFDR